MRGVVRRYAAPSLAGFLAVNETPHTSSRYQLQSLDQSPSREHERALCTIRQSSIRPDIRDSVGNRSSTELLPETTSISSSSPPPPPPPQEQQSEQGDLYPSGPVFQQDDTSYDVLGVSMAWQRPVSEDVKNERERAGQVWRAREFRDVRMLDEVLDAEREVRLRQI